MSVKNLLVRVKELREVMESCQERMTNLIQDYQANVLQTAAVIAAAKINEEKGEIEKKRQSFREQIEKEKEKSRETVKNVYKSAGETIEALIKDQEKEIQEALGRQQKVNTAKSNTESEEKRTQERAGVKRKHSAIKESKECEDEEELSKYTDKESDDFKCGDCGRQSPNMFMCYQCQAVTYCDELCQARDWNKHQQYCTEAVKTDDD